jgi:hypothetical protein
MEATMSKPGYEYTKTSEEVVKIVSIEYASTVEQLRFAISTLTWSDPSMVYVMNEKGERVTLRLRENVLTDGSITYDIIFS